MSDQNGFRSRNSGRSVLLALFSVAFFSLAITLGCAEKMSPEQAAAISRMQSLGGKVVFSDGGYRLNMGGSRVEDADLAMAKNIKNLKVIDLYSTRVTDKGIAHLETIPTLRSVMINRTAVTDEAVQKLKKANPEVVVVK